MDVLLDIEVEQLRCAEHDIHELGTFAYAFSDASCGLYRCLMILLLLLFFKFTPNVFVMGMGALMVFTLLLSLSFEKDMTYLIAAFIFMSGASITAQYYLTAQPLRWLLLSWGIGALPQLSLMLLLKNLLFGFH